MARKVKRQVKSKIVRSKSKEVPTLAKVISILAFIGSVVTVILGILLLVGSSFIKDIITSAPDLDAQEIAVIAAWGPGLLLSLGIIFIGLAILNFFVARGLWKGSNWARIFVIVILSIGAIGSFTSLFSGEFDKIISLIIEGLLIWYFGFNKKVIQAYS